MSPKLRRILTQYGMLLACLLVLGVFLVLPIYLTVKGGITETQLVAGEEITAYTADHVAMVFENPLYREGLINAFFIACMTTVLCVLIALPLALISARYRFPFKGVWNAVILVPLILPSSNLTEFPTYRLERASCHTGRTIFSPDMTLGR